MGTMRALVLAMATASSVSAQVPTSPGVALQHVGKWKLSGEGDICTLQRDYGNLDRPTTLTLQLIGASTGTRLAMQVTEPGEGYIDRVDPGTILLAPAGRSIPVKTRSFGPVTGVGGSVRRQTGMAVEGTEARDLILSPTLVIDRGKGGPPIVIAPGGSAEAADALDHCEDERLRSLGIDAVAQRRLSRWPEPVGGNAAKWFKPSDYPKAARNSHRSGRTVARLVVAPDGSVADCATQKSAGNPDLDAATCTILRARGRFIPALDRAKQPVAAQTLISVMWFWFG